MNGVFRRSVLGWEEGREIGRLDLGSGGGRAQAVGWAGRGGGWKVL